MSSKNTNMLKRSPDSENPHEHQHQRVEQRPDVLEVPHGEEQAGHHEQARERRHPRPERLDVESDPDGHAVPGRPSAEPVRHESAQRTEQKDRADRRDPDSGDHCDGLGEPPALPEPPGEGRNARPDQERHRNRERG
jgi:hypothetical protein